MIWGIDGTCSKSFRFSLTNPAFTLTTSRCDLDFQVGWAEVESPYPLTVHTVFSTSGSPGDWRGAATYKSVAANYTQMVSVHREKFRERDSAIAIANVSDQINDVTLIFYAQNRTGDADRGTTFTLNPREQRAFFYSEICRSSTKPGCPVPDVSHGELYIMSSRPHALIAFDSINGELTVPLPIANSQE